MLVVLNNQIYHINEELSDNETIVLWRRFREGENIRLIEIHADPKTFQQD